ncbi:unnamed protein product [Leuciscus chuanchicus]
MAAVKELLQMKEQPCRPSVHLAGEQEAEERRERPLSDVSQKMKENANVKWSSQTPPIRQRPLFTILLNILPSQPYSSPSMVPSSSHPPKLKALKGSNRQDCNPQHLSPSPPSPYTAPSLKVGFTRLAPTNHHHVERDSRKKTGFTVAEEKTRLQKKAWFQPSRVLTCTVCEHHLVVGSDGICDC